MKLVLTLIAASVLSTITMDIAGGLLRAIRITQGAPPGLIGKWIESSMKGTVIVEDIRTVPGNSVPLSKFLIYHYLIGMLLTWILYVIIDMSGIHNLSWWQPLIYGFSTSILPLFLMFPAMGFGFLGVKGPPEYLLLRTAVLNHLAFGLGLVLSFRWLIKI